ncbi:preprotein translocase subunit SecE [Candidatus Dojkabacteria bacterium]|nr:preprotein translocase subunit SecE [Candidatus Dojkabacteria bacterium]
MNIIKFIKSIIEEAKKIEWLSKKELVYYSSLVILFIVLATFIIGLIDIGFITARTYLISNL